MIDRAKFSELASLLIRSSSIGNVPHGLQESSNLSASVVVQSIALLIRSPPLSRVSIPNEDTRKLNEKAIKYHAI